MTSDELRALKAQWYKAACSDGSIALCALVARALGTNLDARYGPKYRWVGGAVEIYLDDYGNYMTVEAAGKRVCCTHTCESLFVPGAWMDVVRQAAAVARGHLERAEARQEDADVRRLREVLGLDEDL